MTDAARTPDLAEATEQQLLEQAIRISPSEGWTWRMARLAGRAAGLSQGATELALPHGPADLAALLARRHDARARLILQQIDPDALKVGERIYRALEARLDAAAADEAATRRCAGYLSLPQHLRLAGRLAWESADALWRWAGDVSTDENHYSKRAILAAILTGALAIRLSSGRAAALHFVARRIEGVIRFERWKATARPRPSEALAGVATRLGRLRYGRGSPTPGQQL